MAFDALSDFPDGLSDFPRLNTSLRTLQQEYRFCTRCWMPLSPVRRCLCPPEPYPENATPAHVLAEHPQLREMAAAVASGCYADDTATREERYLGFLHWLYKHQRVGEHAVWTYEVLPEVVTDDTPAHPPQSNHTSQVQPNNS